MDDWSRQPVWVVAKQLAAEVGDAVVRSLANLELLRRCGTIPNIAEKLCLLNSLQW